MVEPPSSPAKRFNWWKLAFFVALFAFEAAREAAVISIANDAMPNGSASVFRHDGYVAASGTWKRIDGGSKLSPVVVTLDCREETGNCIEATTGMSERYVYPPDITVHDATFTADAVTFVNDVPDCARYTVRIDTELKKAFAIRQRKQNPANPRCRDIEERIEMQLADGFELNRAKYDDHFLPLLRVAKAAIDLTA